MIYNKGDFMVKQIVLMVFCHLIGDYVLQLDFIAKTKGENWYHLFVHCALYVIPFYICFEIDWRLCFLFVSHLSIDSLKARYNKISYAYDQVIHYLIGIILYVL